MKQKIFGQKYSGKTNLEKCTDEPVCKAETETNVERTNIWKLRGESGGGMNWEMGINIHTLLILCIKQITHGNRL